AMFRAHLRQRTMLACIAAGIVGCALLRNGLYSIRPAPGPERSEAIMRLYMGLDTRADALLVGCAIGLIAAWGRLPTSRRAQRALDIAASLSVVAFGYML